MRPADTDSTGMCAASKVEIPLTIRATTPHRRARLVAVRAFQVSGSSSRVLDVSEESSVFIDLRRPERAVRVDPVVQHQTRRFDRVGLFYFFQLPISYRY